MSKGSRRRSWQAQAMRKRNPEAWFKHPVLAIKQKKNRQLVTIPQVPGKRGRDA